jgi:flagellar basal body-associated protein FliL
MPSNAVAASRAAGKPSSPKPAQATKAARAPVGAKAPKPKSSSSKTNAWVIGLGVMILLIAGAGALFYTKGDSIFSASKSDVAVYYDFPRVTADLSRADGYFGIAKVRISAEFDDEGVLEDVKGAQRKIVDGMQDFLKSKTRSDLDGGPGTELMRQGFLKIVNANVPPKHPARTVLFREIVIQ